jgi:hypothetical protein
LITTARAFRSAPEILAKYLHERRRLGLFNARLAEIDALVASKPDDRLGSAWQELRTKAVADKNANLGPWQQAFRACWSQRRSLRRVYVLPSHDTKDQLEQFKEFMQIMLPDLSIEPVRGLDGELYQRSNRPKDSAESRDDEDDEYVSGGIDRAIELAEADFPESSSTTSGSTSPRPEAILGRRGRPDLNADVMMLDVINHGDVKGYDAVVQSAMSSPEDDLFG